MMAPEPTDRELALLARLRGYCLALLEVHPDNELAKHLLALFEQAEHDLRASPEQAAEARKLLAQLDPPPDPT
jgi:hypothetical protein